MKKFAFYKNLNERQRRLYDRSDAVTSIRVPTAGVAELAGELAGGLAADDRARTERAAQRLLNALLESLQVSAVRVHVLAVRPSNHREELHGQYAFGGRRTQPTITVWMRTAQRKQIVAFRTFYRTLLHEVTHHLDYQLYHFEDSLHTQGFYKRAESLFDQLIPAGLDEPKRARPAAVKAPAAKAAAAAKTAPATKPTAAPEPTTRSRRTRSEGESARRRPRAVTQASLPFTT